MPSKSHKIKTKTPAVKAVLKLMDKDYTYGRALEIALIIFSDENRETIEKILSDYC